MTEKQTAFTIAGVAILFLLIPMSWVAVFAWNTKKEILRV